ncbi:hypothetical protein WAF17_12850 [Bernardetia sp. ABR2-2B]|uniref:hypothetical protein n=1 Tax=Bernardetia sp. ABR2-2B TaxID=3127472 RepID=UPI0030CE0E3F
MLYYKMILNILILFLCTSCCTCSDDCSGDVSPFYISVKDKVTGEDAVIKYNIKEEEVFLIDDMGNNIEQLIYITRDSSNAFISLFVNGYGSFEKKEITLKLDTLEIGKFTISTKPRKESYCCISKELDIFEPITPSIQITKRPQERRQPFYEVQF